MRKSDESGNKFSYALLFAAVLSLLLGAACEPAPSMVNKPTPEPPAEDTVKLTGVEREIRDMKDAGFDIIYVFKRKDGGVFDKEDKQFLRANTPDINRRVLTDDEKAAVAGSNFKFLPEHLEALQKRFVFEDYSKPGIVQQQPASNTNGNTNQAPANANTPKVVNKRVPQ